MCFDCQFVTLIAYLLSVSLLLVTRFLIHMLKFCLLLCSLVLILVLISLCEEKFTFHFTCLQFAVSIGYFTHNAYRQRWKSFLPACRHVTRDKHFFLCTLKWCKLSESLDMISTINGQTMPQIRPLFLSKSIPVCCSPFILHCICRFLLHLAHVVGHFLSCMELGRLTETHSFV